MERTRRVASANTDLLVPDPLTSPLERALNSGFNMPTLSSGAGMGT